MQDEDREPPVDDTEPNNDDKPEVEEAPKPADRAEQDDDVGVEQEGEEPSGEVEEGLPTPSTR